MAALASSLLKSGCRARSLLGAAQPGAQSSATVSHAQSLAPSRRRNLMERSVSSRALLVLSLAPPPSVRGVAAPRPYQRPPRREGCGTLVASRCKAFCCRMVANAAARSGAVDWRKLSSCDSLRVSGALDADPPRLSHVSCSSCSIVGRCEPTIREEQDRRGSQIEWGHER